MADYAGAVAAIKALMAAGWTNTPVNYQNDQAPDIWPPQDAKGNPSPWVYFEVLGSGSKPYATGTPGNRTWHYLGLIHGHVMVPINSGDELAQAYAVAIGEIFRDQKFYDNGLGAYVRSWSPQTDGGDSSADDGNWWRVTCTIPFEYFHRG